MKTLEHRGQKIICQYIDDNFGRILAKKNIKYSILPVFSDNYIVYKCIVVPEDGWDALYNTVLHGECKTSRLKMCINHICTIINKEIADEKLAEGVPIFELMAYPQKEYTSKEWQRIAFYLLTCGYCKENFEVDTNGVDPKWIEKIKEYIRV